MNIQTFQVGSLMYAQIDDMYTAEEIVVLKKELEFLKVVIKQQTNDETNPASKDGVSLKNGHGIFLDTVYSDRKFSQILQANRRIFNTELVDVLLENSCVYGHLSNANYDATLINFYDDTETYKAHKDSSVFTALTFFRFGNFDGGELSFVDYGVSIEPVEGRTVIFPGCVRHQAEPVVTNSQGCRVTMAQFVNYK